MLLVKARTKSRLPLVMNIDWMLAKYGINRILFLTLTTPDRVYDKDELQRRWNSMSTHVLRHHVICGVAVPEQHADGAWHIHCVVVLPFDFQLHDQFWSDVKRKFYARCDPRLRWFWNIMRKQGKAYGFGRFEGLPPKKGGKGLSKYLSKYLSKSLSNRNGKSKLKGMRLVRYINAQPKITSKGPNGESLTVRVQRNLRMPGNTHVKRVKLQSESEYQRNNVNLSYSVTLTDITRWRVATCQYGSVLGGRPFRYVMGHRHMCPELAKDIWGSKWGYYISQWTYAQNPIDLLNDQLIVSFAKWIRLKHALWLAERAAMPDPEEFFTPQRLARVNKQYNDKLEQLKLTGRQIYCIFSDGL